MSIKYISNYLFHIIIVLCNVNSLTIINVNIMACICITSSSALRKSIFKLYNIDNRITGDPNYYYYYRRLRGDLMQWLNKDFKDINADDLANLSLAATVLKLLDAMTRTELFHFHAHHNISI
jgi:hypothetical protein